MVGTVGAARRLGGRGAFAVTAAAYGVGSLAGALSVFALLALAGTVTGIGRTWLAAGAVLAAATAAVDLRGGRVRPQIRSQVPEPWRRALPLPLATFLYGFLLGTGVATYVPAATAWGLIVFGLVLGDLHVALVVGAAVAAGRALPVLVLAAATEDGAALPALALRPHALRVVRLAAGISLAVAASLVLADTGAAGLVVGSPAGDPSAAAADLAWEQPGVGGFLRRGGQTVQLPGDDPAVGGTLVAWHVGDVVTIANRATLAPVLVVHVAGAQKLAVSDRWLAVRALRRGGARLVVQQVTAGAPQHGVAATPFAARLGRPALDGDTLVYSASGLRGSSIMAVDLPARRRHLLRYSRSDQLLQPSLLGGRLLYVRLTRCSQQLRLGDLDGRRGRILLTLPPVAGQDLGHDRDRTSQGARVPCGRRVRATSRLLWTSALASTVAYVTVLRPAAGRATPTLVSVKR